MKTKLLISLATAFLLLMPDSTIGQTINLGTVANFVLFSTNGSVSNTGKSNLTGNVGTNVGSSTAFGNVNGVMHDQDGTTSTCAADLLTAYNQLNIATPTFFPASALGNGTTLVPGVYKTTGASTLNLGLTLDGQGDPNAQFIFQIGGSLSTNAESKIHLINGALACNVFWKVEGLVSMAPGTSMKGTIIANNAAISMATRDTLEGRALSTAGALTVNGILAYTPTGCGNAALTGPALPNLGTTPCYGIFTGNGTVTNSGASNVMGDIGSNLGLTSGFDALKVSGAIHINPDNSTVLCAADLLKVNDYLNLLSADIELLYPAQFGQNLILTPHTYKLMAATVMTDTLYLNAQGNANGVFVIKITGALSTSTYSKVILLNGAQAKNVFWKIDGPVNISDFSALKGTIVANNGAISLSNGVTVDGRVYTTSGAILTAAITTSMVPDCSTAVTGIDIQDSNNALTIAPNPFKSNINVVLNNQSDTKSYVVRIYNVMGKEVINTTLTNQLTTVKTSDLGSGIYFYKVTENDKIVQTGKLISQQ